MRRSGHSSRVCLSVVWVWLRMASQGEAGRELLHWPLVCHPPSAAYSSRRRFSEQDEFTEHRSPINVRDSGWGLRCGADDHEDDKLRRKSNSGDRIGKLASSRAVTWGHVCCADDGRPVVAIPSTDAHRSVVADGNH